MEWLSVKEFLPPLGIMVLIKDDDKKSVGRVVDIKIGYKASGGREKIVTYEWSSVEPYVNRPTHWMHIPK